MPQFTITLDEDSAYKIHLLTRTFGGSIPGFASSFAKEIAKLPINEIQRLRAIIDEMVQITVEREQSPTIQKKAS